MGFDGVYCGGAGSVTRGIIRERFDGIYRMDRIGKNVIHGVDPVD